MLVVGAGPVGLASALAGLREGYDVKLVEQRLSLDRYNVLSFDKVDDDLATETKSLKILQALFILEMGGFHDFNRNAWRAATYHVDTTDFRDPSLVYGGRLARLGSYDEIQINTLQKLLCMAIVYLVIGDVDTIRSKDHFTAALRSVLMAPFKFSTIQGLPSTSAIDDHNYSKDFCAVVVHPKCNEDAVRRVVNDVDFVQRMRDELAATDEGEDAWVYDAPEKFEGKGEEDPRNPRLAVFFNPYILVDASGPSKVVKKQAWPVSKAQMARVTLSESIQGGSVERVGRHVKSRMHSEEFAVSFYARPVTAGVVPKLYWEPNLKPGSVPLWSSKIAKGKKQIAGWCDIENAKQLEVQVVEATTVAGVHGDEDMVGADESTNPYDTYGTESLFQTMRVYESMKDTCEVTVNDMDSKSVSKMARPANRAMDILSVWLQRQKEDEDDAPSFERDSLASAWCPKGMTLNVEGAAFVKKEDFATEHAEQVSALLSIFKMLNNFLNAKRADGTLDGVMLVSFPDTPEAFAQKTGSEVAELFRSNVAGFASDATTSDDDDENVAYTLFPTTATMVGSQHAQHWFAKMGIMGGLSKHSGGVCHYAIRFEPKSPMHLLVQDRTRVDDVATMCGSILNFFMSKTKTNKGSIISLKKQIRLDDFLEGIVTGNDVTTSSLYRDLKSGGGPVLARATDLAKKKNMPLCRTKTFRRSCSDVRNERLVRKFDVANAQAEKWSACTASYTLDDNRMFTGTFQKSASFMYGANEASAAVDYTTRNAQHTFDRTTSLIRTKISPQYIRTGFGFSNSGITNVCRVRTGEDSPTREGCRLWVSVEGDAEFQGYYRTASGAWGGIKRVDDCFGRHFLRGADGAPKSEGANRHNECSVKFTASKMCASLAELHFDKSKLPKRYVDLFSDQAKRTVEETRHLKEGEKSATAFLDCCLTFQETGNAIVDEPEDRCAKFFYSEDETAADPRNKINVRLIDILRRAQQTSLDVDKIKWAKFGVSFPGGGGAWDLPFFTLLSLKGEMAPIPSFADTWWGSSLPVVDASDRMALQNLRPGQAVQITHTNGQTSTLRRRKVQHGNDDTGGWGSANARNYD
eukprot:g1080.t1